MEVGAECRKQSEIELALESLFNETCRLEANLSKLTDAIKVVLKPVPEVASAPVTTVTTSPLGATLTELSLRLSALADSIYETTNRCAL
jgi:hypothetical protein